MRIDEIEFDEKNIEHATRHGVSIQEIEGAFQVGAQIRRNPSGRTGDYYIIANGIRVNFVYRPGVARPISAWRTR
jgi:uncharacterized DUF497 family protein